MKPVTAQTFSLRALRRKFEARVFALPQLQREFVWSPAKARDLVDSIYRGYPIGVPTIWKTKRRNGVELRLHHHILPQFDDTNPEILFIIDGQQRLSCLYQLLRESGHVIENSDGQSINFGGILFRCTNDEDKRLFAYRRGNVPDDYVRVTDLLSSRWRQRINGRGKRELARIEDCRSRLLGYQVPFAFIETNKLDDVQESFIRINALGTRISGADRAFARASTIKLRNLLRGVRTEMDKGFGAISDGAMLQSMAILMGESDIGERSIGALAAKLKKDDEYAERFKRHWRTMKSSFGVAADHLRQHYGIARQRQLPSDYLVSLLALFFYQRKNRRPSRAAKAQLDRWFWSTIVGNRYTGRGFRPNVVADAKFLQKLGKTGAKFPKQPLVPLKVIRDAEYSRPGMITQGCFALLRLQGPRYLEDGEPIPLDPSSRSNRSDKHHIFARAVLSRAGFSASDYNLLPNICYLVARENQSVGSKHPATYLTEVPHSVRARSRALRSHLIPFDDACGIWEDSVKRGYRQFLDARTALISKKFEELAGVRLFRRE